MEVLETSEGNDIISKVYDIAMMLVILISIRMTSE